MGGGAAHAGGESLSIVGGRQRGRAPDNGCAQASALPGRAAVARARSARRSRPPLAPDDQSCGQAFAYAAIVTRCQFERVEADPIRRAGRGELGGGRFLWPAMAGMSGRNPTNLNPSTERSRQDCGTWVRILWPTLRRPRASSRRGPRGHPPPDRTEILHHQPPRPCRVRRLPGPMLALPTSNQDAAGRGAFACGNSVHLWPLAWNPTRHYGEPNAWRVLSAHRADCGPGGRGRWSSCRSSQRRRRIPGFGGFLAPSQSVARAVCRAPGCGEKRAPSGAAQRTKDRVCGEPVRRRPRLIACGDHGRSEALVRLISLAGRCGADPAA